MSNHTPGPWIADDNEGFSPWSLWAGMAPSGHGVAGQKLASVHGDSSEADANARLIASAPDLLEALVLMVRSHDEPPESLWQEAREQQWLSKAREAIAKATGND